MIPIKLTLKNFMSYGDEPATLALEGLHVVCLSGDNGNGKSALLDAMTWALWGKTRASTVKSITEDDLIRVGADEVEVRFEFELTGQRYRVVKKRKRGKSGSEWNLAQTDASGAYVSIGAGSQRETGRQITQLLSMEYETFLSSAYLQQGHADEFARQTPDNRKRILGEILGLDRYDKLEAKARERFRERKEAADELEREIRMLDAEIGRLPAYQGELEQTRALLAEREGEAAEQEAHVRGLRTQLNRLEALAQQVTEAEAGCRRQEADLEQRERERCTHIAKLKEIRQVLDQRESIVGDYTALQTARRRREQLNPQVEAFNKATADLRIVVGAIELEEERLRGDLRVLEADLRSVRQRSQEYTKLEAQIADLDLALRSEAEVGLVLESARAELQTAQDAFADLRARNERLKADMAEIDDVLELLARPQAVCPVCSSDLSGSKHQAVVARQEARRAEHLREQEAVKREGAIRKQAVTTAQERVRELEARHNDLLKRREQYRHAVSRRDALRNDGIDVAAVQKAFDTLRLQLERGEFAAPKRAHRQKLESELALLNLAKAEFETVERRLKQLEPSAERYQDLQHAEGNWDPERTEKERLDADIAIRQQACADERARVAALAAKLGQLEGVKRDAAVAEAGLTRLQSELNRLRVSEGSALSCIAACERAAELKKARAAEHRKLDEERRIYQALAAAFGRRGVQALIIENAIPEVEEETNSLLARMTDNAMQIRFETTKTAKSSGNEIETLDIKVSDDIGIRPYELFSGGEAFRINFAIRIALSHLLARRSGARLQTLILDEGFGTQDGKGREKLIEVIEAIKDEFEKILVITHVDELKDSFAQRIEVTKDAQGSRLHLL